MTIENYYSADKVLRELEAALLIDAMDYEEHEVTRILENVKKRILKQYQLDLTQFKVGDVELEISAGVHLNLFCENLSGIHARLSGYCQIVRFRQISDVSLSAVNYLGCEPTSLENGLRNLQLKEQTPYVQTTVKTIMDVIGNIATCIEKRFFLIMSIAYELGLYEISSAIAEILILGGY